MKPSDAAMRPRYGVRQNGELVFECSCRPCAEKVADEIRHRDPGARVMVVSRG